MAAPPSTSSSSVSRSDTRRTSTSSRSAPSRSARPVDAVRGALSWLGPCRRKSAAHSIHLVFSFSPEAAPTTNAKLKVEINTREHENLYGIRTYPFAVENPWFSGKVTIASFEPEELFGTKLRALLQRRKGRDLFDLNEGLKQLSLDASKVIAAFNHYLAHEGTAISRANAEERMLDKLTRSLTDDIKPMLAADVVYGDDDALDAFERVWFGLIAGLHGEPWHKSEAVIDEFRSTSIPSLLRRAGS